MNAGYREENKTKPYECKTIEATEPVYRPEDCAEAIRKNRIPFLRCTTFSFSLLSSRFRRGNLDDWLIGSDDALINLLTRSRGTCTVDSFLKGEYNISCGDIGVNILMRVAAGMGPRDNTLADMLLMPFLVFIGKVYGNVNAFYVHTIHSYILTCTHTYSGGTVAKVLCLLSLRYASRVVSFFWDREVVRPKYGGVRPRSVAPKPIISIVPTSSISSDGLAEQIDNPQPSQMPHDRLNSLQPEEKLSITPVQPALSPPSQLSPRNFVHAPLSASSGSSPSPVASEVRSSRRKPQSRSGRASADIVTLPASGSLAAGSASRIAEVEMNHLDDEPHLR